METNLFFGIVSLIGVFGVFMAVAEPESLSQIETREFLEQRTEADTVAENTEAFELIKILN